MTRRTNADGQLPPPDRVVELECGPFRLHCAEFGPSGQPPTVLLHGIYAGAHGAEWRKLVPELDPAATVWVPDLLGTGESDRPDLAYTPAVVSSAIRSILLAAGHDAVVVASSLTGAYALRVVAAGTEVHQLILIGPTGLGSAQTKPPGAAQRVAYSVLRQTPLGDVTVHLLSSGPSVRWFQRNKTYADPASLEEQEVSETRRAARLVNAKHLQLAFVTGALALSATPDEVRSVEPLVVWPSGQSFLSNGDRDRWAAAGATVVDVESGLPQVEEPARIAALLHGAADRDRQG